MKNLPPRILIAGAVSVVVLLLLLVAAMTGGGDREESRTETVTTMPPTTSATMVTVSTSLVLRPDWYLKESSLYSERRPEQPVSTLPRSTTTTVSVSTSVPGAATSTTAPRG